MRTLLSQIERFLDRHDMEAAAFGKSAINDTHLVRDMRKGRSPLRRTVRKIKHFMRDYKPPKRR